MIAPLASRIDLEGGIGLALAFGVGVAFGFFLERGGLGNAKKLAGQFYLKDFTVLRVMFTAIVTAMLGLFFFARLGILDLHEVRVVPTYLLPQLVGGLLFGLGFVCAGLCPGTSCVAAATGKVDGFVVLLGIFSGIYVFGETFPRIQQFLYSTSLGRVTFPDVAGLPHSLLLLLVIVLAIAVFLLVARFESGEGIKAIVFGRGRGVPSRFPETLALLAIVLAITAGFAGDPPLRQVDLGQSMTGGEVGSTGAYYLDPLELAGWISEKRDDFLLVDLRSQVEFDRYHIPYAQRISLGMLSGNLARDDRMLVVYTGDAMVPQDMLDSLSSHSDTEVYLLWGGLEGWGHRVLFPDLTRTRKLTEPEIRRITKLSQYFGGQPEVLPEHRMSTPSGYRREGC